MSVKIRASFSTSSSWKEEESVTYRDGDEFIFGHLERTKDLEYALNVRVRIGIRLGV
ncbi:MAG: hypothetical protein WBQ25_10260 [Nitrososphaeraceae archaeon]